MGFGYLSAAIIALIVLLALKKYAQDRAPEQSCACRLKGRSADR